MKRFNYTGRKKILRDDVKIRLHGSFDDKPVVDVSLDLDDYDFPTDGMVYLEPQRKTRFMRIPLGRSAHNLRENGLTLDEFDDADGLKFRVKVVDDAKGLLLGIAEGLCPYDKDDKQDKNQQSILPVSCTDLSSYGVLWRVDFDDNEATLQVEKELGSKEQLVRSSWFQGFILPSAMHQILSRIMLEGAWDSELTDSDEWATAWLLFAEQLGAGKPPSEDSDTQTKMEWVDMAVGLVVRRINARQKAIEEYRTRGAQ
jgi:hypothetical protein